MIQKIKIQEITLKDLLPRGFADGLEFLVGTGKLELFVFSAGFRF